MKKIYFLSFIFLFSMAATAQLVYKDVAAIFYNRCTKCHHPGGGGGPPYSLMSYSETAPWCSLIQADLQSGKMPVWPPDTTYSRFLHERIITISEKNDILSWIASGCQAGDTTQAPAPPVYSLYQLYGTPSMTLQIPTFSSNASSSDAYNCFSLATGLTQDRYLRAFEIVPGNPAIVHHVVVKIDTVGNSTSNTSGSCFNQPGDFDVGGYAPGAPPTVFPGQVPLKAGMRIKAGSKVVMQIHYPAGSAGQIDSTKIRLYFYPAGTTGIRDMYSTVFLQNWTMVIPPNTTPTFTAQYNVLADMSIFATFPHCHQVCKSIENWADQGTNKINLIKINNWDFEWQGYYTFPFMKKIPSGYTLRASHLYDNTSNNPNNPNNPPQLITAGQNTSDEMLFDGFQWLFYQTGDELIDIGSLLANDSLLNPTSVQDYNAANIISSFTYPNPFSEKVRIGYELKTAARISVEIFNMYGSKVKTLSDKLETAGVLDAEWDGRNEAGEKLPAGIYFYIIRTGNSQSTGKIIFLPH